MARAIISVFDDLVKIKCPFRRAFIEALKETIPRGERWFNQEEKLWETYPEYLDDARRVAQQFFHEVIVDEYESYEESRDADAEREPPKSPGSAKSTVEDAWTRLRALCGTDELKSFYRVLAKRYHPDRAGGDTKKMVELNAIFEKLGVK